MPTYPMIVHTVYAPCRNEAFLQLRVAVRVLGVALILNIARFHSYNFFLFCEASAARHLRFFCNSIRRVAAAYGDVTRRIFGCFCFVLGLATRL